jgi:hypothetical protein
MEYIQGFVHYSFAKSHYYEFNMDFTLVVCNNVRYSDIDDYDKESYGLDVGKGFIISVKFFKTKEDSSAYCYLEGYYDLNGNYTKINQETLMSSEFINGLKGMDNEDFSRQEFGGKLLVDVTKKFERDKKIDLILK